MVAIGLALLASLGFGSSAIFARLGMRQVNPLASTLISAIGSLLVAVPLTMLSWGAVLALPAAAFLGFLALGALNFLGGRGQNYLSIYLVGAARSAPFVGASALFAAIFAISLTGERPHGLVLVGTLGVVAGLAASTGDSFRQGWSSDKKSLLGYAFALGAAACYGASSVMAKHLTGTYGLPFVVAAFSLIFGVLLLAPLGGYSAVQSVRRATSRNLAFTALSGVVGAVGVVSLYLAVTRADVVIVSPISSTNPLVTLLMAHLFLERRLERVTRWVFLGTLLAVLGVVLVVVGAAL
ncbi:MAG: DMT family transporter [SAR202 cluster bacterium]|nr:DMT family transporter [SAR202 cluster bacterium]